MSRTQEEIVARIEAVAADDILGSRRDVLIHALDFEHAREYLQPDATAEEWAEASEASDLLTPAKEYYGFALRKIRDHRGISASRSVDKLAEYAWLLGRDDVVTAMDSAIYEQYGAPKVQVFASGFELAWPDEPELTRMAAGVPCRAECDEGCGA